MSMSIFEQVTSSFTVISICGSLGPDIPAGTPILELENLLDPGDDPNRDPLNDTSRVMDPEGNLVGILWFGNYALCGEEDDPDIYYVDDVMDRPALSQSLSSGTTVLEAAQLFTTRSADIFYVIHGGQVVGYLRYQHLFQPVGRLGFLALALEIEDQALRLSQHPPFRKDAWDSIPDNRKRKAIEIFKHRYGREPEPQDIDKLIDCTQLADMATMLWKTKLVSAASSRSEVLGFSRRLEEIRNYCAHPQRSRPADNPIPKQKSLRVHHGIQINAKYID